MGLPSYLCNTLHALNAENYPLVVYTILIRHENLSNNIISTLPVLLLRNGNEIAHWRDEDTKENREDLI